MLLLLPAPSLHAQQVFTVGEARKVMMGTDLSAHIALDSLLNKPNLYALGPMDDLQGELLVLNSRLWHSTAIHNQIELAEIREAKAPFMVYAYVAEWQSHPLAETFKGTQELANLVRKAATAHGIPANEPFVFRLTGQADELDMHIIMKPAGETTHSHEAHKKAKRHFSYLHTEIEILGFYSEKHEGVFTHKGERLHMHYMDASTQHMGHIDGIATSRPLQIWFPVSH
ncbi:MAG: acetolactate decarboxylase [Bacteroidia bacterium]